MEDDTICPACVLEFLKTNEPSALGTELDDLFQNKVIARRCDNHQNSNIFIDLDKLRKIWKND